MRTRDRGRAARYHGPRSAAVCWRIGACGTKRWGTRLTVQACMDAHESATLRRDRAVGLLVRYRGRAGKPEIIRARIDHQPCRGKPRRHQHGQEMSGRRLG
jgi:hypothetical protein